MSEQADASRKSRRVGFIGLGRMGLALATNLLSKQHDLMIHDVNPAPVNTLVARGAKAAASLAQLATECDVVFTMLPGPSQVRSVWLDASGLVAQARPCATLIDLSTIDVETVDALAQATGSKGLRFADAPVGRLASHADRGQSLFMVGADAGVLADIEPLLLSMGTTIQHCGGPGTGTRTKLVNNFMVLCYCQINSEALVFARAMGLDLERTLDVLLNTTAVNGQLRDKWRAKVLGGDLSPGFDLALGLKDITLACASAHCVGAAVPVGGLVRDLFQLAHSAGHAGQDTSAMTDYWASVNGLAPLRLASAPM